MLLSYAKRIWSLEESKIKLFRVIPNREAFIQVLQQQNKEITNQIGLSNTISSSSNYLSVAIEGNTNFATNLNANIHIMLLLLEGVLLDMSRL